MRRWLGGMMAETEIRMIYSDDLLRKDGQSDIAFRG